MHSRTSSRSASGCGRFRAIYVEQPQSFLLSSLHATLANFASVEKKGQLTIQCDEMWSSVGNKKNKHLFWLALDIETKEIVGV